MKDKPAFVFCQFNEANDFSQRTFFKNSAPENFRPISFYTSQLNIKIEIGKRG